MQPIDFDQAFQALTGNPPFPWQKALYKRFVSNPPDLPSSCNLPTGLGKTAVIAIWLIALANHPNNMPRRLVYVVNRRTVVDQTTDEVVKYQQPLADNGPPWHPILLDLSERLRCLAANPKDRPLAVSTLRGQFADNREWSADPSRPAIICGTVDMIGSRLLFSGYGCGFKSRPLHAGFLGQDVLVVHDEAHLEPAFQKLIVAIRDEQAKEPAPFGERHRLRVLELTATSRANGPPPTEGKGPIELTKEDRENKVVKQRIQAKKGIAFHKVKLERGSIAAKIGDLAAAYNDQDSQQAILVFVRTIDDVNVVAKKIAAITDNYELLTGTMRGKERDELICKPVFRRFRPGEQEGAEPGTVYLICTSAGEVGIDISADHLVCDLTPFDSEAQRFGRVNRRGGDEKKAHIDIVYETDPDPKKKDDPVEKARWATLKLFRNQLSPCDWDATRQEASPESLGNMIANLSEPERIAAFTPQPTILPVSDILFDAWALTTVRELLPGRPPVEPYLHGISGWEPPESYVAWRHEVELLEALGFTPKQLTELLDDYPLKPHELLRDVTYRVRDHLDEIAVENEHRSVWLVSQSGDVTPLTLGGLVARKPGGKNSDYLVEIAYCTVVLPPQANGLTRAGMLGAGDPAEQLDIADEWRDEGNKRRRVRLWDKDRIPDDVGPVRLVRTIDTKPETEDADTNTAGPRYWKWYVRPRSADEGGGSSATKEQLLNPHLTDTAQVAGTFADKLLTDVDLRTAVRLAALWHDLGKHRELWQRNMGNTAFPTKVIAKTGHKKPPRESIDYRHEFGSLLDVQDEKQAFLKEFAAKSEDIRELILHMIATHHGRGRPHFPADEAFDPDHKEIQAAQIARQVPQRYARLQRKYGRWGLAWLESLLRAADAEASANPDEVIHG